MRKLTLKRDASTDLTSHELRDLVVAGDLRITGGGPACDALHATRTLTDSPTLCDVNRCQTMACRI